MTKKDLERIAYKYVNDQIAAGRGFVMEHAVTQLIASARTLSEGDDFFMLCAHEHVWRVLKAVVDKYEFPELDDIGQACSWT
jgi:hypothetical protein